MLIWYGLFEVYRWGCRALFLDLLVNDRTKDLNHDFWDSLTIQLTVPFGYFWRSLISPIFGRSEYLRIPNAVISSYMWSHLVHITTIQDSNIHVPSLPWSRLPSVLYQVVDDYIPNLTSYLPPFGPLWSLTWLCVFWFWPRTILSRRWPNTMGRSSPPIPMYLDLRRVSVAENWHVDFKVRQQNTQIKSVGVGGGWGSFQIWWIFYCSWMK